MRKSRLPLWLSAGVVYFFLYLPIAVVIAYSFNSAKRGGPWRGFTTEWYGTLLQSPEKVAALRNTAVLAITSTAVSTVLGTLLGYGLSRYQFPGRKLCASLIYLPVVMPDIVAAIALLLFFSLLRSALGLFSLGLGTMIIAHITFQIPFVAIVVRARLANLDPVLDEAAHDLGADTWQKLRYVTLPLLAPGILAGAALAFTLSIDDFVISFFTAGPGSTTLPILIYSSVKRGITPDINALSTVIVLASIAGTIAVSRLSRARDEDRSDPTDLRPRLILLLVLVLCLTGCSRPKAELNLFIWSEYMDPALIAEFERRFDCRVNLDYYEDPESMVAKLAAGGASTYDLVVPSDNNVPVLVQRGLLAPLRPENIPNLRHIAPEFRELRANPGLRYAVPYQWGAVGLYVRRPKGQSIDESWALVFDPARQAGPFLLMDDLRATLGAALRYRGHSLNSANPADLAAARDLLISAKKRSLGFEGGVGCKNRVLARGAAVAMAYNGDAANGAREDSETYFFVPREGSQIYMDFISIPAQAPHRDLAEKFINFILEPEIAARLANFNHAPTPNQAALALIDPADRRNPAIYPPPEVMARLEYAYDLGETNRLYDDTWTQVKSK